MNLNRLTERKWIRRALGGDREAAERLAVAHYPGVIRFLLHLCGDLHVAEELAQEAFLHAWRSLAAFEGRSSLRTWLHRIAYREFAARRQGSDFLELTDEEPCARSDFAASLIDALAIERAISGLPEPLRITFVICHVQEMSIREAADILSVPAGTVLSRLHTARERLRRQLTMFEIVSSAPIDHGLKEIKGPQNYEVSQHAG